MFIPTKEIFRWRRARRNKHEMSICTKLVVVGQIVFSTMSVAVAATTATGGAVDGGAANGTITQAANGGGGTDTTVTQTGARLTATWTTLGTAAKDNLRFMQNASDVAINKVTGFESSEFYGSLTAGGRVFILNPNGVYFGAGSSVNVGSLVATTANNVTEGADGVFHFTGSGYGQVVNQGNITVSQGGFAILAAPYVENTGTIMANLGTIQLASANHYTVDLRGDGLITFTVTKESLGAIQGQPGVDNSGTLTARSGTIGISANLASEFVQGVVNLNGVVDATALNNSPSQHNGGTVLVESVGDINVAHARTRYEGQEPIDVSPSAGIHADGAEGGNGGTIQIIADGTNHVYSGAILTARGGPFGGNGGLIEVSGHDVIYRGAARADAPSGTAGTLRIDPDYITIANGDGTDGSATIYEKNVEDTSNNGTNVELIANDRITMENLADGSLDGGSGNITMQAGGDCTYCTIRFDDKSDQITTTATTSIHAGSISMTALDGGEGGMIDIGSLHTTGPGGSITLVSGSRGIDARDLSTGGARLHISDPGKITLTTMTGGNITTRGISVVAEAYTYYTDEAVADLEIHAYGGKVQTGTILVSADAYPDYDSNAWASATAHITGQDITIDGNMTVFANAKGGHAEVASANAHANLIADNDVKVTGDTTVQAIADMTDGSNAMAEAGLLVHAGHDIAIDGKSFVTAKATQTGSAHASSEVSHDANANAYANANYVAGGKIKVTGDTIVTADAMQGGRAMASTAASETSNTATTRGATTASANLSYAAGEESDISITGDTHVTANATRAGEVIGSADARYGGSGQATAQANATANAQVNYNAGGNIDVTGDTFVTAKAKHTGDARAYAYGSSSSDGGSGAYAIATAGASASANAKAFYGATDIAITGKTEVTASATELGAVYTEASYGNVEAGVGADAGANATYFASHDLTITGNTLVTADATHDGAALSSTGEGAAAPVGGNNTTAGTTANASALMIARNQGTVKGDTTVASTATTTAEGAGTGGSWADANLIVNAANDLAMTGNIAVSAIASQTGVTGGQVAYFYPDDRGQTHANACLDAAAGGGGGGCGKQRSNAEIIDGYVSTGNLVLTGDTSVTATTTRVGGGSGSGYYDRADASARESLYAPDDVIVTGNSTVQAAASNTHSNSSAMGRALLSAIAGRDLNVMGSTLVKADALLGTEGDHYDYQGYAVAGALTVLTGGRNVTTVGTANTVTANAENQNGGNSSDGAEGAAALIALAGVDARYAQGLANNIAYGGYYSVESAVQGMQEQLAYGGGLSSLPFGLNAFGSGNLHMTGDVAVTANATSVDPNAFAGALALFGAGNDVTVLTDPITARATAKETGTGYCDGNCPDALAASAVVAAAGLAEGEGGSHGNLLITGDIVADASASGVFRNAAYAIVGLHAPDNVTNLYATTPPTASASPAFVQAPAHWATNFFGEDTQETSNGFSYAAVSIDGGGLVVIEPKVVPPTGCPADVCEVLTALSPREPIGPLFPGADPLRIGANGEVLWATAVALTAPPQPVLVTPGIESAIASGADPTTLLPATAAGAQSLSAGLDAFSVGGADFCDQVVSGSCLPKADDLKKKK
jgi:filamentous hemagglutinin family protein